MTTANPTPPGYAGPPAALKEDGGFMHFVRFFFISLLMTILTYVIVGIIWQMIALSKTGRRKRDILMFLIPIWGIIVSVQTGWRYTAKNVYWSVRDDRPSSSLFSGS